METQVLELTDVQLNHFHTFGYVLFRQLFSPEEVAWITEEFETAIQTEGGGNNHDGTRHTQFLGPIDRTAKLCTLLDDPRIVGILGGILGPDFNYCSGDGNYFTGNTAWHPDGNWGQLFAIKAAFYLDSVTCDTGCLRVIPGSHDPNHLIRREKIDPNLAQELFGVEPRDFPGMAALETIPGDLVVFNHDTYHSSWGGSTRRRMFTMNCTRYAHSDEALDLVRKYVSVHTPGAHKVEIGAGMYSRTMLDTADEARRVHLAQPAPIHDELFPQYARR